MLNLFELLGASLFVVTGIMTLAWLIGTIKNNIAVVDIGWGLGFFASMLLFFALGEGSWLKKLILTGMVSAWSLRLTWHLWRRFEFRHEDPRYTELKVKIGPDMLPLKMLLLCLFQGFLIVLLCIPFVIVASFARPEWHPIEGLGILIFAGALAGVYYADRELEEFKSDPENKGKVCDKGLWKYSRHPNYFFEWVVWVGFFLFAFPSPMGGIACISPLLMLILLTRISGIPLTEAQALRTRGEAYKQYQEKTSCFIPLPPKK